MTRIFITEHSRVGAGEDDVKRSHGIETRLLVAGRGDGGSPLSTQALEQRRQNVYLQLTPYISGDQKKSKAEDRADTKAPAGPGLSPAAAQGSGHVSLEGVHSSVEVPHHEAGFWEQWRAFVGPAILVSVGYMDPGNWGTDLQSGAQFKYGLLWVVGLASLMAIFMQVISARLGVVTGKDLAQCCRDWYPKWTRWPNWLMSEVAIGACDLAEVLGSAVALNLMFHIPLLWAVIITGLDVLLLLGLQRFGMRTIEAIVLLLIVTIGVCYFLEIFVLPETQPSFMEMARALISPRFGHAGMLYIAIGMIGATVMPHNLYLHSALVQSRQLQKDDQVGVVGRP